MEEVQPFNIARALQLTTFRFGLELEMDHIGECNGKMAEHLGYV